ncbi:uncharacterized protein LOC125504756, partial [Dendroctonus ponderosae]|uniref:uncharacterized protein LOC125504756 n=1 Tax=Dendroctonus ponderosae TaxID=77166 RepID=UPI0020351CE5
MMRQSSDNKVHPYSKLSIMETPLKVSRHSLCVCQTLKLCIFPMRLIGRFPYSWRHLNGKCAYELSSFWMLYSCVLMTLLAVASVHVMPSLRFQITNMAVFLDSLANVFSVVYWSVAILYLWNVRLWLRMTEGLIKASRDHLFCPRAKKLTVKFQKSLLILIASVFTFENGAFMFFAFFTSYKLPLHVLFFRNMNITPSVNYVFWFSCKCHQSEKVCVFFYMDFQIFSTVRACLSASKMLCATTWGIGTYTQKKHRFVAHFLPAAKA